MFEMMLQAFEIPLQNNFLNMHGEIRTKQEIVINKEKGNSGCF
jgi:hypothetical protein